MPKKTDQLKADNRDRAMLYRSAEILRAEGVDEEQRSVPVVLATETPVATFDFETFEIVDEVLLMNGLELPDSGQVPLLDTHDRWTTRSIHGSIREMKVKRKQLLGRTFFSAKDESQILFRDVADGHITDLSVGAERLESTFIPRGDSAMVAGRRFKANDRPMRIVTRSRLREGSYVAIGADTGAKVSSRAALLVRSYTQPEKVKEEMVMDELRKLCLERGMDEKLDDRAMLKWLADELHRAKPGEKPEEDFAQRAFELLRGVDLPPANSPGKPEEEPVDPQELLKRERERISGIDEICRNHGVDEKQRSEWLNGGISVEGVAVEVLRKKAEPGVPVGPGGVDITRDSREKFVDAAGAALTMQMIRGQGLKPHKALERAKEQNDLDSLQRSQQMVELFDKPPAEAADLRYAGPFELARAYCELAGLSIKPGMPKHEIARMAISHPGLIERSDGPAYATTGSFPSLMLNAQHKVLLMGYDEAEVTYPVWARTGSSVSDFKQFERVKFGELPDPEVVPENHPYPEKQPTDDREFSRVEKYGEVFSTSLEAIVNDDLNAISRIPAMQGAAMRRTINRRVYNILTSNPTLRDGIALFHATSHGANLDSTALAAGAPLDTGFSVMMTQSGLNTNTILNIMPRYLIVPAALSATALQIATQNIQATQVANTNLYGPGGPRPLTVVADGQIDGSSTTAWWLAASTSQVDTVEVVFLQGEESPVLERQDGFLTDSIKYKIRQSFVAFPVDFRGLYQGNS